MIREAQFKDIPQIYGLIEKAVLVSSRYQEVDFETTLASIKQALSLPNMAVFVSDNNVKLGGVICGVLAPSFHGKFLVSDYLIFYSHDGKGGQLFKRYVEWVSGFKDAKQIEHDGNEIKLFKRYGFEKNLDRYVRV